MVESLHDLMVRYYLINSRDVRFCPKEGCGFAASILLDPESERIECDEPFSCEKCGTQWKDPLQREAPAFTLSYCIDQMDFIPSFGQISNIFWRLFSSEPCPGCGVLI